MTSTVTSPTSLPRGLIDKHIRTLETLTCITERCDELESNLTLRCKEASDKREKEIRNELNLVVKNLENEIKILNIKINELKNSDANDLENIKIELNQTIQDRNQWRDKANEFERRYKAELERSQTMLGN